MRPGSALVGQENTFIPPLASTALVDGMHELHEQSGLVLLHACGLLRLLVRDGVNQLLLALQDAGKLLKNLFARRGYARRRRWFQPSFATMQSAPCGPALVLFSTRLCKIGCRVASIS